MGFFLCFISGFKPEFKKKWDPLGGIKGGLSLTWYRPTVEGYLLAWNFT
jgi:hypothetical protein